MTREEARAFFKDMNECTYGNLEAVEMAIKALEQEPNWIPVSERLPEDNTKVLVTMDATYKEKVLITWYQDKEHGFLCGLVKAWMPLPEPYKGEQPKIIKCPNCGNVQFADKEWCPDCGAKMD